MRRLLLVSAAALTLGGCVAPAVIPPVSPAMAGRGVSVNTLEKGRSIYTEQCTKCHRPYSLEKYRADQWHDIVVKMSPRARLDAAQTEALLAYISGVKRLPPPPPAN